MRKQRSQQGLFYKLTHKTSEAVGPPFRAKISGLDQRLALRYGDRYY